MPELAISVEKVGFLIEKTREYDVKEGATDPDSGSNGADDNMIDVLEDNGEDPVVREITGFIKAMTEDEQVDLVALMRLGRGDGSIEEWDDLRREAADLEVSDERKRDEAERIHPHRAGELVDAEHLDLEKILGADAVVATDRALECGGQRHGLLLADAQRVAHPQRQVHALQR